MTCIYFSVSLNVSGLEFKILGESYVSHFFYLSSKSLAKVYSWTHCKSGSGYTGSPDPAYARPSRTAETKCAFGAKIKYKSPSNVLKTYRGGGVNGRRGPLNLKICNFSKILEKSCFLSTRGVSGEISDLRPWFQLFFQI